MKSARRTVAALLGMGLAAGLAIGAGAEHGPTAKVSSASGSGCMVALYQPHVVFVCVPVIGGGLPAAGARHSVPV